MALGRGVSTFLGTLTQFKLLPLISHTSAEDTRNAKTSITSTSNCKIRSCLFHSTQITRNFSHFMVSQGSLPHHETSQTVPILSQISTVHAPSHFLKMHFNIILPSDTRYSLHFNIILPSNTRYSKWYLSLTFPH